MLALTGVTGGALSVIYGTTSGSAAQGNDSRITGALSAATAASTYQTALGFTPYNATNPSGYRLPAQVSSAISGAAYSLPAATTSTLGGVTASAGLRA